MDGPKHASPGTHRWLHLGWVMLVPFGLATLAGLVLLWPSPSEPAPGSSTTQEYDGRVIAVDPKDCSTDEPGADCGTVTVVIDEDGTEREIDVPLSAGPGAPRLTEGDDVVVAASEGADGTLYGVVDHQRSTGLLVLGAAFVLALVAFGRWRGVTALAGLAITFVVLLVFMIPAMLSGEPPVLVAIVGSAAITLTVLYLTHGPSQQTTVAVVGTLASLGLTGALSAVAVAGLHLTGVTDDISTAVELTHGVDVRGLLVASIIIGSVGVLDDVTVTQSATVTELARANPSYGFGDLYRAAARIGRSHIASVVNTIVLAYAGSSLPLLVLIVADNGSLGDVVTTQLMSQEIVRSAVATIGLIAAVPLTTALAALATRASPPDPGAGPELHVH